MAEFPRGEYPRTEQVRQKNRAASLGRIPSVEQREKQRLSMLGKNTGPKSNATKEKIRQSVLANPFIPNVEQREKMKTASYVWSGRHHSQETKNKISLNRKGKHTGEEHSRWKGSITILQQKLRQSQEGKDFRRHVFQRDNWTCQGCGQFGGKLTVDHELPFAYYPDLRFEILNGRVLCVVCHKKTPTFAGKAYQFAKQNQLI